MNSLPENIPENEPRALIRGKRNLSRFTPRIDGPAREEKGVYSPDPVPGAEHDVNPEPYTAIADHAKHLRKAERSIDDASNLVGLMLASLDDESDGRAMQTIAGKFNCRDIPLLNYEP